MAYKFQLGPATLSGSITHKEAPVFSSGFNNNDQNITNVGVLEADTIQSDADGTGLNINFDGNTTTNKITLKDNLADALNINEGGTSYLKFTTTNDGEMMTAGKPLVMNSTNFLGLGGPDSSIFGSDANTINIDGNTSILLQQGGSTKATVNSSGLSVSGQVSGSGNLLVGGTVRLDGVAQTAVDVDADSILFVDATNSLVRKETMGAFATDLAGDGITVGSNKLAVNVDDSSIETNSDAIRVKASGITNAMLAGSIANAKLENSTISGVALGSNLNDLTVDNATLALNSGTTFNGGAARTISVKDGGIDTDALGADAVTAAKIADDAVQPEHLHNDVFGLGLAPNGSSNAIDVQVDDSSIEINSDSLRVKASGVTNAMLAGSIANAKLANSAVTVTAGDGLKGGGSVSLGGSVTLNVDVDVMAGVGLTADNTNEELDVSAAQTGITSILNSSLKVGRGSDTEYIDFSTDNQIHFVNNDEVVARVISGSFVVHGDLHVSGTTTTVDSTTIHVSSSFTFEGPVDAHETKLEAGTPVADTTVQLPEFSSAGTYYMAAFAADPGATGAITATPAELNLVDGGTARGTEEVANGDGFLHNDGGTMRMTNVSSLATLFAGNGLAASNSVLRLDINGIASAKTTLAQADLVGISDSADANAAKKITFSNLEDQIFGNVSGDALIAAGGALTIQDSAVENDMLAGSIADSKLNTISTANKVALSALDIDGGSALGSAGLAQADLFIFDDGAGGTNKSVTFSNLEDSIFGNVSGDATIAAGGALTIANDAVEQAMIADDAVGADQLASDAVVNASIASGAAIAHSKLAGITAGSILMGNGSGVATATAISGDIALTALGATSITSNAVHASMLNTDIISGLDDIGAAIVSTDELLISDAGTIRRTDVSRLKTFVGAADVAVFGNANATLEVGVNYSNAAPAADRTLTLPASAGMVVGQSVKVKANADMDNGNYIIARAGSQTIDGATSITLESPLAAVELVYVAADLWKVF